MMIKKLRSAMAMIELIFAIVIMAIVLMSAPMLVSQANKSISVVLQQEAIAAASSQMGLIMAQHWDEGDTNESMGNPPILTTESAVSDLNETKYTDGNLTGKRAGTPPNSNRTFIPSLSVGGANRIAASAVAAFGNVDGDFDDVDDYNGATTELTGTTYSEGDYIDKNLTLTATVEYLNDSPTIGAYSNTSFELNKPFTSAAAGGTTNIKRINVVLTTNNTDEVATKNITLNGFSCNVGTYYIKGKSFP